MCTAPASGPSPACTSKASLRVQHRHLGPSGYSLSTLLPRCCPDTSLVPPKAAPMPTRRHPGPSRHTLRVLQLLLPCPQPLPAASACTAKGSPCCRHPAGTAICCCATRRSLHEGSPGAQQAQLEEGHADVQPIASLAEVGCSRVVIHLHGYLVLGGTGLGGGVGGGGGRGEPSWQGQVAAAAAGRQGPTGSSSTCQ